MEPAIGNLAAIDAAGKHVVAWQGVRVIVPLDWEPGALSGAWNEGYFRIDERLAPRLVVRWLPDESTKKLFARAASRQAGIQQVAENYLDGLVRTHKKKRRKVEHRLTDRLLARRQLDITPVSFFEWELVGHNVYGVGFSGECPHSGRILLCEMTGMSMAETRDLAVRILATLRPYPEADDAVLWSAFGLRLALDKEWKLSGTSLLGGKVEFRFDRPDGSKLAVQRWIASIALGKGDLVTWAKKQLASDLKNEFRFRMERGLCRGHPAVLAEGTVRSAKERVAHSARRFVKIETAFHLVCRAWHCEPENKLFVVRAVCKESERGFADEATARFVCHI